MARRRKKHRAAGRSSRQHVDYAGPGILPYEGGFRPVKARGGELGILKEPRGAIREHPFAFVVGAFLAGVVGTIMFKNTILA